MSLTGRRGRISGMASKSFSGFFFITFHNGLYQVCGRRSFHEGNDDYLSPQSLNHLPAYNVFFAPVPAFHQDVGLEERDDLESGWLVEDCDVVHTFEAGENLRPFGLGEEGTFWAFQIPDGVVAVDTDDQYISEGFGLFQIAEMTDMEEVETPIGKNNSFPFCPEFSEDISKVFTV